jgi:poly-gamma-glutamate synthesis protein (capsule biosynthesis protein)
MPLITAAGMDCSVLANNHVLEWGREGLFETLTVLEQAGCRRLGRAVAGRPPRVQQCLRRRKETTCSCSLSRALAAGGKPGVNVVPTLAVGHAKRVADEILGVR